MTKTKLQLILLFKLPLAFIAGLRLISIDHRHATVGITHRWINQNPFRSIYFAALAMAGELSTGLLVLEKVQKQDASFSFLVSELHAHFVKKAKGKITFTCCDGELVDKVISKALADGKGHQFEMQSIGKNEAGEEVARFDITWSIKVKNQR